MLKETETEETIVFFVTFLSLVAFQLGGRRAPCAPLATPIVPPQTAVCKMRTSFSFAHPFKLRMFITLDFPVSFQIVKVPMGPAPKRHISGPCSPNHCLCSPSEKCASKARIVPQNKVTGPVPLEYIVGLSPQKILLVPPRRE